MPSELAKILTPFSLAETAKRAPSLLKRIRGLAWYKYEVTMSNRNKTFDCFLPPSLSSAEMGFGEERFKKTKNRFGPASVTAKRQRKAY